MAVSKEMLPYVKGKVSSISADVPLPEDMLPDPPPDNADEPPPEHIVL